MLCCVVFTVFTCVCVCVFLLVVLVVLDGVMDATVVLLGVS